MLAEALLCRVDMIPLSMDAEEALLARTWPGKVRELQAVLRIGDIQARYEGVRRICGRHLLPEVKLEGATRSRRPPGCSASRAAPSTSGWATSA